MLRINLLPPYIYEGAKRTKVTILWVVILLAVIGGMVFGKITIDNETKAHNEEAARLEPTAKEADDKARLAQDITARSAVIVGKATFVENAKNHAAVYPAVYSNVAQYTWRRVLYDQVAPQGQSVQIAAFAPSLADVGHYMMAMENNPEIAKVEVGMNSIPTIPAGAGNQQGQPQQAAGNRPPSGGHDFNVVLTLNKPVPPGPTYGTGGGGGQQGPGGFGGGAGPGSMGMGGPGLMSGGGAPAMGPAGGGAMMGSGGGGAAGRGGRMSAE